MTTFYLKDYIVEAETEINESEFSSVLTINVGVVGDKDNVIPNITNQVIVINSNKQTGFEMDEQRQKECEEFVQNNYPPFQ
jgi:hypothetical protein